MERMKGRKERGEKEEGKEEDMEKRGRYKDWEAREEMVAREARGRGEVGSEGRWQRGLFPISALFTRDEGGRRRSIEHVITETPSHSRKRR